MPVRFTVLASGSRGNASLVRAGGAGVLIDLGLGPVAFERRLAEVGVGAGLGGIAAALLTHTHADHVRDLTLKRLARAGVPLYCHAGHEPGLSRRDGFADLVRAGLVRTFDDRPFWVASGVWAEPIALHHDGATFGFRLQARDGPGRRGRPTELAYLADTGCWTEAIADALADVDLLGVEANHDVHLQRTSGRPWPLVARNLGDHGHLSNDQAAGLLEAVWGRSRAGAVGRVVLLHLSEQCNRPELALGTAREAARRCDRRATIVAAGQWTAGPDWAVRPSPRRIATAATGFPWEAA